jgi:hypothetical protein
MRTQDYEIRLEMQVSMSQGFAELRASCVLSRVDSVCSYPDRTGTKHLRNLRLRPQFFEGFRFTDLALRIGNICYLFIYSKRTLLMGLSSFAMPCLFFVLA